MNNQGALLRGRRKFPTLPKGDVVATYERYEDAQKAVDLLARADFPVARLSIVGSDMKSVERVTGKLTWGKVALAGAASGAWLGAFLGLVLVLFSPTAAGISLLVAAVFMGAGFGMMFGLVSYAINRSRRDFTSTMQVFAASYSIVVDPQHSAQAANLLGIGQTPTPYAPPDPKAGVVGGGPVAGSGSTTPSSPESGDAEARPKPLDPPEYGERLP